MMCEWVRLEATDISIKFHKMLAAINRKWMDTVNDNYAVPSAATIKQTILGLCNESEEFYFNNDREQSVLKTAKNGILVTMMGGEAGHTCDISLIEGKRSTWELNHEEEEKEETGEDGEWMPA